MSVSSQPSEVCNTFSITNRPGAADLDGAKKSRPNSFHRWTSVNTPNWFRFEYGLVLVLAAAMALAWASSRPVAVRVDVWTYMRLPAAANMIMASCKRYLWPRTSFEIGSGEEAG